MARSPGIPDELKPEVLRRAAAGQSNRTIAAWLEAEHGIRIAHTTIGRLVKSAGKETAPGGAEVKPAPPPPEYVKRDPPRRPPAKPKPGNPTAARCGGVTKYGGRCRHAAGLRTEHPGTGRCWLHEDNRSRAERGNQKALKTGQYQSIFLDVLDATEREMLPGLLAQTPGDAMAEDAAINKLRVRRMLDHLKVLKARLALGQDMMLVQQTDQTYMAARGQAALPADPAASVESVESVDAPAGEKVSTWRANTRRSLEEQIRLQEHAITQVYARLVAAERLRHKIAQDAGPSDDQDLLGDLKSLLAGIEPEEESS